MSTLNDWNQIFDEKMRPIIQPDHRGKSCKVTPELVKRVVEEAQKLKSQGNRIRVKSFTRKLVTMDISLSSKTVGEILIANDLREPQTRKRRPRFYQSLCQRIPNGLLSLDGGEFVVWFGDHPIPLNLELSVDTGTFTHTAFSIGNTETRHEVLNVLKSHIKTWGQPIGVLFDHGSANLSHDVQGFLKKYGIEIVPAGPANPKGNGSLEGAFSQMKQVIGTIYIDPSSPETLAKSILQSIAWVYIKMRNKLSLRGKNSPPIVNMNIPLTQEDIENERKRLQDHKNAKLNKTDDQPKIDRIRILIKNMGLNVEPPVVQRAEKTIIAYEMKAIMAAEKAFIKAVNRKNERSNLPYFFGILKNIQQQRDDDAYKEYCRQRYHYEQMFEEQRRSQFLQEDPPKIGQILSILEKVIDASSRTVKNLGLRRAREWTEELSKLYSYTGSLKKRFLDVISKINHLSVEKKEEIWSYIQEFLNIKSGEECVTCFN